MRLTRIELYGFKSFADRVQLELPAGLTSIVGPNGCGKSNVMDAIKWALGEQRPTALRGDEMMDVVFKGNGARAARNFAEVSLVFDNEDGKLPVDYTEVVITRRLFRSGESEYLINKQACRLKDVRSLLMDTGLGTSAYSIMEQGRIDAVLSANPAERRRIFEEAAGISRYRAQRRESESKLARTEQNLLRLGDIVEELEKRVRSLKQQAGRARSYVIAKERLAQLKALFYAHRWKTLAQDLERLQALGAQVEQGEAEGKAALLAARAELDAVSGQLDGVRAEVDAAAEAFRQATGATEALSERRSSVQLRLTELNARREELASRAAGLDLAVEERRHEVEEVGQRLAAVETELETCQVHVSTEEAAAAVSARAMDDWRRADEARKTGALQRQAELTEVRNLMATTGSRAAGLKASRDRVSERATTLRAQLVEHESMQGALFAGTKDLDATLVSAQGQVEAQQAAKNVLASQIEELDAGVGERRERLARADSRRAALDELIKSREGVSEGALTLLRSGLPGVEGLVVDHLDVPTELAEAVEAALGTSAEAVIVARRVDCLAALGHLRDEEAGRVLLLPRDGLRPREVRAGLPGELLLDRLAVTGEQDVMQTLLGHVRLVSDAAALGHCSPDGTTVWVTPAGELLDERGVLRGGRLGREGGLVSRRAECAELTHRVEALEAELRQLEIDRRAQMDTLVAQEGDLDAALGRVRKIETERERAREQQRQIVQQHEALQRDVTLHDSDVARLERELSEAVAQRARAEEREAALVGQVELDREAEVDATRRREELETDVSGRQSDVASAKLELSKREERREALATELRQVQRGLTERTEEAGRLTAEQRSLDDREHALTVETRELEGREALLVEQRDAAAGRLGEAKQDSGKLSERIGGFRQQVELCEARLESAAEAVNEHRMREQETRIHRESLREKVLEELDVDLETQALELPSLLTEAPPEAELTEDDAGTDEPAAARESIGADAQAHDAVEGGEAPTSPVVPDAGTPAEAEVAIDWEAVEREIEELRARIARMGNVNMAAIDELGEVEERLEFLTTQRDDLLSAKRSLVETIGRLNKESRERFVETFEDVRGHFRQIFRKLFHGGKADITLAEGEDVLESGVDIVAAPPGKDARSISLLSGGERTLTAVGLLFALFKTRPSPVCLLDEVDAALDETNIDRFCTVLEDFLGQSQFLVVTHARRTMGYADTIYGITMQEHGVSRALSLTLAEYEANKDVSESQASSTPTTHGARGNQPAGTSRVKDEDGPPNGGASRAGRPADADADDGARLGRASEAGAELGAELN